MNGLLGTRPAFFRAPIRRNGFLLFRREQSVGCRLVQFFTLNTASCTAFFLALRSL